MHPVSGTATPKAILLQGTAGPSARILVKGNMGNFSFKIRDLTPEVEIPFSDERVIVTGLLPVEKLTDDLRDDDYPSIAVLDDKTAWAVWQSYSGLSDEIRLSKYDETWKTFTRVPGVSGDVWRPQLALDSLKLLWVVWSQQVDGNFDLYARALNEETNNWEGLVRLSHHPYPDIDHHLIADSRGHLWVVWQGFHGDNSDIFLRHYDGEKWSAEVTITEDPANDWEPRVAVDDQGRAHIVWDTYRNGNYDVYLRSYADGKLGPEIAVADTVKFEAHATVAVDGQQRVWVAWDEGGVNWGKDAGPTTDPEWLKKGQETWDNWIRFPSTPGQRLYESRQINLVVFEGDQRRTPVQDLRSALSDAGIDDHDFPQLLVDAGSGRVALLFQRWGQTGTPNKALYPRAAFWEPAVTFYEGDSWSPVVSMPWSWGRPSMRPAANFGSDGKLWVIWPTDGRDFRERRAIIGNVIATNIPFDSSPPSPPQLREWPLTQELEFSPVHPTEREDIKTIQSYRTSIRGTENRIVRGDLHRHTEFSWDSVGGLTDGSIFDFYRYMLDAAGMEFGAITDHNAGGDYEYWWWLTEKSCDLFHIPSTFATFYAYERSVTYPHGHRNIFHTRRGIPVISFFTKTAFDESTPPVGASAAELMDNDPALLFETLRKTGGISIPHTSGSRMGTNWEYNDPLVEPVVEIFQGDRISYEHPGAPRSPSKPEDKPIGGYQEDGFVWNAYRKGYRIGTIASSDHWSTHISYAMVYTGNLSREAIFDGIKKRRTYGATDNIVLDYRMGRYFMGEEFTTSRLPALKIRVIGTARVARIDIIKNQKVVYSDQPNKKDFGITYLDNDAEKGTSYYYVRVLQEDREIAWGSPIWVDYRP